MKKITITIDIEGNAISRDYMSVLPDDYSETVWGERVLDMLDTLEKSQKIPF